MQRNLASWRSSTNRCVCPPTVGYLLERLFRLISIAYCRGSNLLVSPLARRLLNGVEVKNSYFNKSSPTFVQQKHSQLYIQTGNNISMSGDHGWHWLFAAVRESARLALLEIYSYFDEYLVWSSHLLIIRLDVVCSTLSILYESSCFEIPHTNSCRQVASPLRWYNRTRSRFVVNHSDVLFSAIAHSRSNQ